MDGRFSIKKPIKKAIAHRAGSIGGSLAYANRNLPPHIQAAEKAVALLIPILWFSVRYRLVGALTLSGREMRKRKGAPRGAGPITGLEDVLPASGPMNISEFGVGNCGRRSRCWNE